MKSLCTITYLFFSVIFSAQEKKSGPQDQEKVLKEAKELQMKMQKENEMKSIKKERQHQLASEQTDEVKEKIAKIPIQNNNQGKLLPNNAGFEEILASITNRQHARNAYVSLNNSTQAKGLPNTATLEEIKKTIPKN